MRKKLYNIKKPYCARKEDQFFLIGLCNMITYKDVCNIISCPIVYLNVLRILLFVAIFLFYIFVFCNNTPPLALNTHTNWSLVRMLTSTGLSMSIVTRPTNENHLFYTCAKVHCNTLHLALFIRFMSPKIFLIIFPFEWLCNYTYS